MKTIKNYYDFLVNYDLINKLNCKNINKIIKIKKISFAYDLKKVDYELLVASKMALELITFQKSFVTSSKKSNAFLKTRKGDSIGNKITLRKRKTYEAIFRLVFDVIPKLKTTFLSKNLLSKGVSKTYSIKIENNFCFSELENQFLCFKDLPSLNISILASLKHKNDLIFLLNLLKITRN